MTTKQKSGKERQANEAKEKQKERRTKSEISVQIINTSILLVEFNNSIY